jgi:hypothetical protein
VARHKGFELAEDAVQRFSRERDKSTQRFSNEQNGVANPYQKTVVVYGESVTIFW